MIDQGPRFERFGVLATIVCSLFQAEQMLGRRYEVIGNYPDRHALRGSYGGYVFPLHDRRPNVNATNIAPGLVASLSAAYGEPVVPEDIFDAILCLLSATSYSLRFAEDLEDVFPHVPFPATLPIFQEAARIGREIRAVETFAREAGEEYRRPDFVRVATQPRGALATVDYADGSITLCSDGSGRVKVCRSACGTSRSAVIACCHVGWKRASACPPTSRSCVSCAISVGASKN